MDQGIGTVLQALERNNISENTVIFFLSDNGGNLEGGLAGAGPATDLGLHKTDRALSYGQSWANASNTPFREYKHYEFEGGISTPLIISWPDGIVGKDRWVKAPAHLIDLMPTLVEISGATYPTRFKGSSILPMEGVSLVPLLTGKPFVRPNPLFWEHEGNRAVRDGKWKLVAQNNKSWELYDLELDRSETNNLAPKSQIRVSNMTALWEAWAIRAQVNSTPTLLFRKPNQRSGSLNQNRRIQTKNSLEALANGMEVDQTVTGRPSLQIRFPRAWPGSSTAQ